jgi:hypothetical protein
MRLRLTQISMVAAVSPESKEISLREHEGKVLTVLAPDKGSDWVYSARVVDAIGLTVGLMAWQTLRDQDIGQYLP